MRYLDDVYLDTSCPVSVQLVKGLWEKHKRRKFSDRMKVSSETPSLGGGGRTYWTWPPVWPDSRWSCRSRWSRCRRIEPPASDTTCCSVWSLRTADTDQFNKTERIIKADSLGSVRFTAIFQRQAQLVWAHTSRFIQIKLSEDPLQRPNETQLQHSEKHTEKKIQHKELLTQQDVSCSQQRS